MKLIQRTTDTTLIKSILAQDSMYDGLVYDGSPSLQEFVPNVIDNVWFVLLEDRELAGLITLEYLNYVLWTPHIFIFEKHRGGNSPKWAYLVAHYMREQCGAKKFLALTPYKAAKKYAEKVGFKYITTLSQSIKKNNVLLNQYMLEME